VAQQHDLHDKDSGDENADNDDEQWFEHGDLLLTDLASYLCN
jgi:hypothetical protein